VKKLFGSSGIRGLVNVKLTPLLAVKVGLAVATFSKANRAIVGRDTRVSGLMLENALISGLLASGVNVERLGVVPTPVLAYLTRKLNADVGLMITASHNPPQYNGIKIFDGNGTAYNEEKQKDVEIILKEGSFKLADWWELGDVYASDMDYLYIEDVLKHVRLSKNWHIILDVGCGAAYKVAPKLLKMLGCKVTTLNGQPDGFFPGRSPEPNAKSLKLLAECVKRLNGDLGIAYDGDADRVAFIDENGRFIGFDEIFAAYAASIVRKRKNGLVVTNVEASMAVERMVEPEGGKVIRTKVGDVYIAEALKKNKGVFGGEPCGAWIHPSFHYCPDGILSSVLLLKALEEKNKSLSEFVSEVPKYITLRQNVSCKNEVKYKVIEKVKEQMPLVFSNFKCLSIVDGVRLTLKDCWILVRASGTEPLIRLTVEGESFKRSNDIMKKSLALIKKIIKEVNN